MNRRMFLPGSPDELWDVLDTVPEAILYNGGTDVFVKMRHGLLEPTSLICLERISELRMVEEADGFLTIGAGVTHTGALEHPLVRTHFPLLARSLSVLGSPPIRNMGTIGGNIVTASPAGDSLPPLYVADAEVEVRSKNGSRTIPIGKFIKGPGKTELRRGEVAWSVRVKKTAPTLVHFEKVGRRKALAIAVVSMAAMLRIADGGVIEEARLAWGSVGPTVVRSTSIEQALKGKLLDRRTMEEVIPLVHEVVSPIDDIRAGAEYRRTVAGNLLLRLIEKHP